MRKSELKEIRRHLIKELKDYEGKPVKLDIPSKILEEILFDYTDDGYKKFAFELYDNYDLSCEIMTKVDFTGVSFKDFKCNEINFSKFTGITLKPQEIFEKKLTGNNLNGVILDVDNRGFEDVYIERTSFKGAKVKDGSLVTINPQLLSYRNMQYCVFDGVVFTGSFDGASIEGSDFRGSIGALIDPQTIAGKDLSVVKFGGVKFINNFMGANIERSDFTGSKGAIINPQTIANKSLFDVKLKDTCVIGENMDGVILFGTDFTDADGDISINPQNVSHKKLDYCKLFGVRITGPIDGCSVAGTDFTGSIGAYITNFEGVTMNNDTNLASVIRVIEEEPNKQKIKEMITKSVKG